jgi:hypothetical protein
LRIDKKLNNVGIFWSIWLVLLRALGFKLKNVFNLWTAGIVSYGDLCSGGGVYTRVAAFEQWIAETMRAN